MWGIVVLTPLYFLLDVTGRQYAPPTAYPQFFYGFLSVAMAWQIYELTNSAWQIGLLGLARAVPHIALALLGGLMADAMERRRLIMRTQIAQLTVPVTLAGLTLADAVTPSSLYVASALLALARTLETPARQALVPNLVPRAALTSAIALNSAQRGLSMFGICDGQHLDGSSVSCA